MDNTAMKTLADKIDGYKDEAIRLQTEMCKRPALGPENGGDGEVEKAAFLKSYLSEIGFKDIEVFSYANHYPISYWFNMAPFPDGVKKVSTSIMNAIGIGKIPIPLNAGNQAAFGFNN